MDKDFMERLFPQAPFSEATKFGAIQETRFFEF